MKTAWCNTTHTLGAVQGADEEFAAVFDVEDVSDTVVACRDGNVYVGKTLLAARAPYFKSLIAFNSNAGADKQSTDQKYKIDWTAHSSEMARALLLYLYTGKCTVHDQHIDDLIDLAAQVFVKSQRFERMVAALMHSMLRTKYEKDLTRCEINNMLERMYKHTDSLPDGTAFATTVLKRLGGGAHIWRQVFTVPMTVDVAALKKPRSDNRMQELAQVTECTVLALLQWAKHFRSADDKLSDTQIVFDLLSWSCAIRSCSAVREPFCALLQQGGLDLQCVEPVIIKQYVEPVGALSVEELLSVYRAQATKPCCNAKGAPCYSYPSWPPLRTGTKLDVLDPYNNWYMSEVLQVNPGGRVLVHYINWSSKYDEWIPVCSPRLAHVNTHTTGPHVRATSSLCDNACVAATANTSIH
jgi:BTB/POZ domain/mbt repeat